MAKILILCSRVPYPPIGGARIRIYNTARLLSEHHNVDLLIVTDEAKAEHVKQLRGEFDTVKCFRQPSYRIYANTLRGMVSRKPLQTFYFRIGEANAWLDRHSTAYDLFFCNHVRTAEYVRSRETSKVIDLVDAISRNYEMASQFTKGLWRVIYPLEARRLRWYEPEIVSEFNHAIITTDADRRHIQREQRVGPISVVPNGVREELLRVESRFEEGNNQIMFLGKMDYEPNIDAVEYFANDILPIVRQEIDCQFTIVGGPVADRVSSLETHTQIEVTGYVDEPAEYLSQARVVVAPIRFGAGLQNKILEAMALGRPVVTTPLGAEGIETVRGKHLLIAEDSPAYASSVLQLLSNIQEARRIGHAARDLVEHQYRWEVIAPALYRIIDGILK